MEVRARRLTGACLALLAAAILTQCGKGPTVLNTDPGFRMSGGKLFYQGKPFTGTLRAVVPASKETSMTPFRNGVQHGTAVVKHANGKLVSKRK